MPTRLRNAVCDGGADAAVHGGLAPGVARRLGRCVLALLCCLAVATGCSRKPARAPTSPQPPRPQIAPDGQLKSLLGNAVLSNALLSYKLQCTEPTANVRVCHAPPEIAQRHAIGGT